MMTDGHHGVHGQGQDQHDQVIVILPHIGRSTLHRNGISVLIVPDAAPGLQFRLKSDSKVNENIQRGLKRVAEALAIEDYEEDCERLLNAVKPLLDDIAVNVWDFEQLLSEIGEVHRDPVLGRISLLLHGWTLTYQASELLTWTKLRSDLLAKGIVLKIPQGARETWNSFLAELLHRASVVEGDPGALPEAFALSQVRAAISTKERLSLEAWKERGGEEGALVQGPVLLVPSKQMNEIAKDCGLTLEALSHAMARGGAKIGVSVERSAGRHKGSYWRVLTSWVDEPDIEGGGGYNASGEEKANNCKPPTPPTPPTSMRDDDISTTHVEEKNKATKLPQTPDTSETTDTPSRANRENDS